MIQIRWLIFLVFLLLVKNQNHKKYIRVFNGTKVTYDKANKHCQDNFQTGRLVIISNSQKQEDVKRAIHHAGKYQ